MVKRMPAPVTSRIEQLPDDILVLILLFLPTLAEIARTSILTRRWRNVWHHITCLDFNATTVLPIVLFHTCRRHAWRYVAWVNKVIDARTAIPGLPLVKELRISYRLDASQGRHIDRWISFAIENQVEKLHLHCSPYENNIHPSDQFTLSEESWYRDPSGLSSLKSLKSLFLSNVNVSKQFIEFVLSSCPLLEDLTLDYAGCYHDLDVSGVPPLRLKRLNIDLREDFVLNKLDAPYLTSLRYRSDKFKPQKIDVPMLTELTIGSVYCSQRIMDYLDPFWSYLPQLEKLELIMEEAERFRLNKVPMLVTLKYLKICICAGDYDLIFCKIINFINACPLLETFALEMFHGEEKSRSPWPIHQLRGRKRQRRKKQKWHTDGSLRHLKVLELYGAGGETIDLEVTKYITRNAPHLKKLIVYTRISSSRLSLFPCKLASVKVVEAKAKELCQGSCSDIEITVYRLLCWF